MENCIFYTFAIFVFLIGRTQLVSSIESRKGLKKISIESSNNETFSITSLPSLDVDTNETWSTTGFHVHNMTTLFLEYPFISSSSPAKNYSRFFSSKNSSASLTISIKGFKFGVMFLNFTYFIGRKVTSKLQAPLSETNVSNLEGQKLIDDGIANATRTSSMNSSLNVNATIIEATVTETTVPNINIESSKLNQSSVSVSSTSLPKDVNIPVVIKPDRRRKRRSTVFENLESTTSHSVPSVDDSSANKIKVNEQITSDKSGMSSIDENITLSPILSKNNVNISNTIDALTLVQAVEMIKSAAAVISKSSVVSSTVANALLNGSGRSDNLTSESQNTLRNVEVITEHPKSAVESVPTSEQLNLAPKKSVSLVNMNDTARDVAETDSTNHDHHKSKNDSDKILKNENERKGKGKKAGKAERNKKDEHSDENDNEEDISSSSSSSSSEENEENEHKEKKPKISYKMWRASLEKKNRPPGFYVTINDDIIFDNWEGIWDKHHVLGKWTGSRPLASGQWNRTSLFINWDDVTNSRDFKITFEWEPIDKHSDLFLSDIDISTMISTEAALCSSPEKDVPISNDKTPQLGQSEAQAKSGLPQNPASLNETDAKTIVVLKQIKNGKEGWEIVRSVEGKPSTWVKDDKLHLHQADQISKKTTENSPEDILLAILESLYHSKNGVLQNATETGSTTTPVPLKEDAPSVDQTVTTKAENSEMSPLKVPSGTELSAKDATELSSLGINTIQGSQTAPYHLQITILLNDTTNSSPVATNASRTLPLTTTTATVADTTTTTTTVPPMTTPSTPTTTTTVPILLNTTPPKTVEPSPIPDTKPNAKPLPARKTDKETALMVSILTGSIALVILVFIVKKRIDLSSKSNNAARRSI